MGGKWEWMLFSMIIMGIHAIAILIFTRGFLLTRTELPYYSHCSDLPHSPCSFSPHPDPNPNPNPSCWTKPVVDRVLIVVLDALRFDFVAPSSSFPESKPWMDRLKVLQRMASREGSSAQIFKAIADPPTTSLQRLKGLTTGGLPTFIDVGHSFGAPAIVEDNLINQLVQNGKRVVMMGDDTWIQLFPQHFIKAYPYPSFNVKDLHTVDNGCIDHLLPSLYQEDWDVLIAHFLGLDHAGHIFGVNSIPMIEKLEQYDGILEKVIEVLRNKSGPGGLHENTLLLVMGDHGQTLNGDHGGGTAEEVETSIFAMNFKKPPHFSPSDFDTCELNLDESISISSIQQLDFAVTVSALLGIPFPFGSIGRVDPKLYALGTGTWSVEGTSVGHGKNQTKLEEWMQNYANILCINSWQVKRYIDVYSASSVIGFSSDDLLLVSNLYAQAEKNWSHISENWSLNKNENYNASLPVLSRQIDAYFDFLSSVADLARSKWTEFNIEMMSIGVGIMLISLFIHVFAMGRLNKKYGSYVPSSGDIGISFRFIFSCFVVVTRACSFLSNSYILEEGKVANFLLATTGIVKLRYAIMQNKMLSEAVVFILLISVLRFTIEVGLSKQAATSAFMNISPSWMLGFAPSHPLWIYTAEILPMLAMIILAYLLYKTIASGSIRGLWKYVIVGTTVSYMLILVHWASESNLLSPILMPRGIGRNNIPRLVYAIGFGQLLLLAFGQLFNEENTLDFKKRLVVKTVAMLSTCSSTVIILSGKQGSLIALAFVIGGYCIIRLENIEQDHKEGTAGNLNPLSVTQWSLLAVCLFFSTGHWCAFDGLRYGAAFIGFDEFILIRQAILLTIDTFGFSHFLPIFGLPFLAACQYLLGLSDQGKTSFVRLLSQMYMLYGLITATAVTATIICVTIQRRHLMVWGLFAPKFVFDVVGLILTDVLICLASLYYLGGMKDDKSKISHRKMNIK
ncbi:Phosphodiest domain-containing protein [Cephalotus follicularis]|uniref:Phosphodiest domain-containing protein n=1 Tax=Cephalotus follicularis TaxID=3775 RepID=A0A1Q3CZM9_CEPFO|nr:Phosphodiest domain-containing protein [Cephalotus follicularis]